MRKLKFKLYGSDEWHCHNADLMLYNEVQASLNAAFILTQVLNRTKIYGKPKTVEVYDEKENLLARFDDVCDHIAQCKIYKKDEWKKNEAK